MIRVQMGFSRALTARLRFAEGGNITVLMAFIVTAVIALAGVAIDLQFTIRQKNKVQHALDSAVLAGSLDRQNGAEDSAIISDVQNYVESLINTAGGNISCGTVNVLIDDASEDIGARVTCTQPTFISGLIGHDHLNFTVSSTSTYSVGKVDVAFVFDVSGSMNSYSRLDLLKTAAGAAFDELLPDGEREGTIRIGIATYNNAVNAGPYLDAVTNSITINTESSNSSAQSNYNNYNGRRLIDGATGKRFFYYQTGTCNDPAPCDRYDDWSWHPAHQLYENVWTDSTCVFERTGAQADTDAAPGTNAWIGAGNPAWNFGSNDRNKYDGWQEVAYGHADASSKGAFSRSFASCENSTPVPLTDNKDALKTHVTNLTAGGGTAGHLGIAWGWYLISPNWASIWPTASEPWGYDEPDSMKVMVLMTDGDFNSSHPSASGNSFQQSMDLCDSMKASPSKVQIYTVGFQVPSNVQKTGDGRTILEYCATSPAFAYSAADGDELLEVYKEIAQQISQLRIKE